MKRIVRALSACAVMLLIGWYCIPRVYHLLHLPDVVEQKDLTSAPTLELRQNDARFVRESGDERLNGGSVRIALFGILPIKTVSVTSDTRSVVLGGETVGVVLKTRGVQIVGFEKVDTSHGSVCPAASAGLREGDMICAVNGKAVIDTDSFVLLCADASGPCELSCIRNGETFNTTLKPETDRNGEKKIGAWVRDSTSGIGTLSFYDRESRAFAALGHGVTDVDTGKLIAPAEGFLTTAKIREIRRGTGDSAGELIGSFSVHAEDAIASVDRNTAFGISGTLGSFHSTNPKSVEIAPNAAVHRGNAYILSTVDGTVSAYSVEVIRIDVQSSRETQGVMIEITDPVLLSKTGGIVQGMSGSPLIQDGRLIGVVTHVFISQPTRGYCLYADRMAHELLPTA